MKTQTLPYEEAAERVANIEGWVCKTCKTFFGESEHPARWCCAKDIECDTEGCDTRIPKPGLLYCQPCLDKRDLEKYLKLEEIDWDGEAPLTAYNDDRYYFNEDDLREDAEELEIKPWEMRLMICVKESKPLFEVYEFLQDYLCEGQEYEAHWAEIDKQVNDWIDENAPTVWVQGTQRVSEKSLRLIFAE